MPDNTLSPTCELWIDGAHVADSGKEWREGATTALEGLSVSWGRSTLLDQPDAAVCSFSVHDRTPDSILTDIHVGQSVEVWAAARYDTTDEGGDPRELIEDGGFSTTTIGPAWPRASTANLDTPEPWADGRYAVIGSDGDGNHYVAGAGGGSTSIVIPPAPFAVAGDNPAAWSNYAQLPDAHTFSVSLRVRTVPGRTYRIQIFRAHAPWPDPILSQWELVDTTTETTVSDGGWQTITGTGTTHAGDTQGWPVVVISADNGITWNDSWLNADWLLDDSVLSVLDETTFLS